MKWPEFTRHYPYDGGPAPIVAGHEKIDFLGENSNQQGSEPAPTFLPLTRDEKIVKHSSVVSTLNRTPGKHLVRRMAKVERLRTSPQISVRPGLMVQP